MDSPILMGPSGIGGNFGAAEVAGDELAVVADFAVFVELLHDATIRTPLAASAPNVTCRRCVRTGPPPVSYAPPRVSRRRALSQLRRSRTTGHDETAMSIRPSSPPARSCGAAHCDIFG